MSRSQDLAALRARITADEAARDELQVQLGQFVVKLNQEVTTLKQSNQAQNQERARTLQNMLNDHMNALLSYEASREKDAARQHQELADHLAALKAGVDNMRQANRNENSASRTAWRRSSVVLSV